MTYRRIAGTTIAKAFGIEASSCWYGGYVIVNAKLYYGANIVGAGVLGAGAIGGGAAGAAAADGSNKNVEASKVLGGDCMFFTPPMPGDSPLTGGRN
jgi:hypothetical protein